MFLLHSWDPLDSDEHEGENEKSPRRYERRGLKQKPRNRPYPRTIKTGWAGIAVPLPAR